MAARYSLRAGTGRAARRVACPTLEVGLKGVRLRLRGRRGRGKRQKSKQEKKRTKGRWQGGARHGSMIPCRGVPKLYRLFPAVGFIPTGPAERK